MRIIVVGDFHLPVDDHHSVQQAVQDMNRAKPDLVVPLGDFGNYEKIGSPEGLKESYTYLSSLECRIRPILGNHDLQRETGSGVQAKGTMERALQEMYQLSSPYGVIEMEDYRLFFISTENQSPEDCYHIQECYVSEEQFAWLRNSLEVRPQVPAVFFTHAPPIGTGLKTVPGVHVRGTNAYLDQNHDLMRWFTLFADYPQIVMWFSAHYHLGHDHPDSMTMRYGTRFFHTGVHGEATRDGQCHSRVIDLDEHFVRVSTLDHRTGQVRMEADWEYRGSLYELMKENDEIDPADSTNPALLGTVPVGIQGAVMTSIFPINASRCLIQGEDHYLWEVDVPTFSVIGTLEYSPDEKFYVAVTPSDPFAWIGKGSVLTRVSLQSPLRFVRSFQEKGLVEDQAHRNWDLPFNIVGMVHTPAWGSLLWMASNNALYSWDTDLLELNEHDLPSDIQNIESLMTDDEGLWIVREDGTKRTYTIEFPVTPISNEKEKGFAAAHTKMKHESIPWVENEQCTVVTQTILADENESAVTYRQWIYACMAPTDEQSQAVLQIWEKRIELEKEIKYNKLECVEGE